MMGEKVGLLNSAGIISSVGAWSKDHAYEVSFKLSSILIQVF